MYRIFLLSIFVFFFTNCTNIFAYELSRPIKNANVFDEQIEDIKIYYYTIGEKQNPPLVFLHGLLAFTETYRILITSLSEKYFVIGIDLPGHGRSTVGKNNLDADKIAEYIIQLTDKINIQEFYIVGHSAGGVIAMSASKNYPDKVIKAVTIASPFNSEGLNFDSRWYKFISEDGFRVYDHRKNDFLLNIFNASHRMMGEGNKFDSTKITMGKQGNRLYPSYTRSDLKDINTPFLIVVAEKDDLIFPDHSISMAEHLLNSELLILKNANHASVVKNRKNVKIITKNIFKFFDNRV